MYEMHELWVYMCEIIKIYKFRKFSDTTESQYYNIRIKKSNPIHTSGAVSELWVTQLITYNGKTIC